MKMQTVGQAVPPAVDDSRRGGSERLARPYALVVIGASLGGAEAMATLLSALPRDFALPIVTVFHRSPDSDETLIRFLASVTPLLVKEADDKAHMRPGTVYVAPADYHLLVEQDRLALSTEAPVSFARPSIDVLFESAADAWGKRLIGVILTGTRSDGAQGLACIKSRGGLTVAQLPSEALSPAMPEAAMAAGPVDHILPLAGIAKLLTELCRSHER